jgi:hypothetical protein
LIRKFDKRTAAAQLSFSKTSAAFYSDFAFQNNNSKQLIFLNRDDEKINTFLSLQ